jgi:SH3 domain-containing protein
LTNSNRDWRLGSKGVVGVLSCVIGLGVVYFGYGIGTESPGKKANAKATPAEPQRSKKPVRSMNLALGNMVFFAQDLGFAVKNIGESTADVNGIAARIESQLNGIRQLYRQEIAKNPALAGGLVLQFNIDPTGEVSQIRELSSRLNDEEFKKAVAAEASKWSFAEIATEKLQVTCPLLFVHEGMDITTLVQWEKALANSREKPALAHSTGNVRQEAKTAPATAPAPSALPSQRAAVKTDAKEFQIKYPTSLRNNPNFSATSLTTFTIGTKVTMISRQGDWLEVRSRPNGPTGFVRKEFVVPLEVAHR